eukprot:gene22940-31246_t
MDCLKSQNQIVNAAMFPGGFAKSSYSTATFPPSKTGPVCSLASYLQALERPVAAVILQSPYTSIRDAASDLLGCTSNLMLDRWQNWVHLVGNGNSSDVVIKSPVLLLHADNDKIINCNHSRLLHQYRTMLSLPSELFIQASTDTFVKGHNFFDYEKDVLQPAKSFLSRQVPAASSLIALPLEVVDAVNQIPALFRQLGQRELQSKAPVASSKIDRDTSLIASSRKCSDKCALAGWAICCCVFCGECWLSLGYRVASKAYYMSLGRRPFFDYQLLKPQDDENGKSGSILLLFDKSAIVENPAAPPVAAAAAAKVNTTSENAKKKSITELRTVKSDVRNPLQSQDTASSKSTKSTVPSSEKQEGPKTVYFLPG